MRRLRPTFLFDGVPLRPLGCCAAFAVLAAAPRAGDGQTAAPAVSLHLEHHARAGEVVLVYGPLDLPPHAMPPTPVKTVALSVDGWMRGFRVELVDGEGRRVPQRVVHHVNVIVPQKRELFSNIMLRIAAAGAETAPVRMPWFLGYRFRRGDSLLVSAMLHNESDSAYRGVRLIVRLPFRGTDAAVPSAEVYPFYLDVMPPAGQHSFDLPPGRSTKSWEGKPAVAGRILAMGGHMHRYGVALRLEDVTARKVLWEAKPDTDDTGEVVGFPIANFIWRFGVSMDTSHVYRLTAIYDNPTGRTIMDGGMGALGGVFRPSAHDWPSIVPGNAEYELDRRVTYGPRHLHGMAMP